MRFSILHLSDLHRDLADEIPNGWLIDSIEQDLNSLAGEDPAAPKPSLCVVSGDLIYGVSPTASDVEDELKRQTAQALDFLVSLAERLFDGDRERVVILPGNHDVSYKKVVDSCAQVPMPTDPGEKARLVREYFTANSRLRWSWSDLSFFRIVDVDGYSDRLSSFANLYEAFYQGRRIYALNSEAQFDIFDFPNVKLSFLALSSCHGNDPWQRAGRINPTALTEACRQLRSPSRAGWLLASAWHHNLAGGPSQDDYLDPSFLQLLIDSGVSLGLHGHQHRPEWFDERYRLGPKARKIVITSATTLCAGPTNLSPGAPRGYNVIELDNEDWTARLHQRQMVNLQFSMPVWGPGHFVETNQSYVDFRLSPPSLKRPVGLDLSLALEAADVSLGKQAWREVIRTLAGHMDDVLARRMCLKALQELNDAALTIKVIGSPRDNDEAVVVGSAILESGDAEASSHFLSDPFILATSDASVEHIVSSLRLRAFR